MFSESKDIIQEDKNNELFKYFDKKYINEQKNR